MPATAVPPFVRPPPDPRNIITEDAFRVDPELLGRPLARPWRRAAAMAVDGLLIALLTNQTSILFGLAAALVLFRASAGWSQGGLVSRGLRLMFRFWAAVFLFAVAVSTWNRAGDAASSLFQDDDETPPPVAAASHINLEGLAGLRVAAEVMALAQADDEAEARERGEALVSSMRRQGVADGEVRGVLRDVLDAPQKPWLAPLADSLLRALGEEPAAVTASEASPDSLVLAYAAALERQDTAAVAALRPRLGETLAAGTVDELRQEIADRERQRDRMAAEMARLREEAESGPGLLATLRGFADDLGLGFGWSGLYFTAWLALWRGMTPGKRLLGIRVIRLDGKPVGWWSAFERFGGYAAGFATGLLGFLQVLWDRNRQGIHDKIAETVVVMD